MVEKRQKHRWWHLCARRRAVPPFSTWQQYQGPSSTQGLLRKGANTERCIGFSPRTLPVKLDNHTMSPRLDTTIRPAHSTRSHRTRIRVFWPTDGRGSLKTLREARTRHGFSSLITSAISLFSRGKHHSIISSLRIYLISLPSTVSTTHDTCRACLVSSYSHTLAVRNHHHREAQRRPRNSTQETCLDAPRHRSRTSGPGMASTRTRTEVVH